MTPYSIDHKLPLPIFISFEGVEGSGKSSVVREIQIFFQKSGVVVKTTIEPGGTYAGKAIRKLLLDRIEPPICPLSELLLFLASRVQLIEETIKPALKAGISIISDRFHDSSIVYQGIGRKLGVKTVTELNAQVTNRFYPHLTFLLDVDAEEGMARIRGRNKRDRFDEETISFHRSIQKGFLKLANDEPERIVLIDTKDGLTSTVDQVIAVLKKRVRFSFNGVTSK
jgi:dTMP kinase